jgi:hypothetical protein
MPQAPSVVEMSDVKKYQVEEVEAEAEAVTVEMPQE